MPGIVPVQHISVARTPIPIRTGDSEAYGRMWTKVQGMSDDSLETVWESLRDYDPAEYYDQSGLIGMDSWAEAIYSEMSSRGLPTL